jgi:hypothetical protein
MPPKTTMFTASGYLFGITNIFLYGINIIHKRNTNLTLIIFNKIIRFLFFVLTMLLMESQNDKKKQNRYLMHPLPSSPSISAS